MFVSKSQKFWKVIILQVVSKGMGAQEVAKDKEVPLGKDGELGNMKVAGE